MFTIVFGWNTEMYLYDDMMMSRCLVHSYHILSCACHMEGEQYGILNGINNNGLLTYIFFLTGN